MHVIISGLLILLYIAFTFKILCNSLKINTINKLYIHFG